ELRQVTSEICVPRVAVHDVDALHSCRHREIDRHGLQRGRLGLRFGQGIPRLMVRDSRLVARGAPAVDRDLGQPAKLSREVVAVAFALATPNIKNVPPRETRFRPSSIAGTTPVASITTSQPWGLSSAPADVATWSAPSRVARG